jgi:tRNA(fMet)-specific endonuclease VapC
LYAQDYDFCISAITEFEIYTGATKNQIDFWNELLKNIDILPFDHKVVKVAVEINGELKQKRKQIGIADLLIASTAISNKLRFVTLNKKHFERIESIELVN